MARARRGAGSCRCERAVHAPSGPGRARRVASSASGWLAPGAAPGPAGASGERGFLPVRAASAAPCLRCRTRRRLPVRTYPLRASSRRSRVLRCRGGIPSRQGEFGAIPPSVRSPPAGCGTTVPGPHSRYHSATPEAWDATGTTEVRIFRRLIPKTLPSPSLPPPRATLTGIIPESVTFAVAAPAACDVNGDYSRKRYLRRRCPRRVRRYRGLFTTLRASMRLGRLFGLAPAPDSRLTPYPTPPPPAPPRADSRRRRSR